MWRKKFILPDRESNPGLPRDRRRSSPLDYRGLDCVHSAKIIAWLRKWILSSQLELSWWERRILCYPAYTGLNCSHIRWPYSGQSEHSTDHHITCTHPGLPLVSCIEGRSVGGKKLALYTEIEEGPTPSRLLHKICPFFFELGGKATDHIEIPVAFACLQKRKEKICIVRESNPGRPRGRRAFYHWTNDATLESSQKHIIHQNFGNVKVCVWTKSCRSW